MEYPEETILRIKHDLENQIRAFLERTKRDVKVLKEALAKDDYENIWIIGKSMKEAAQIYGFNGIINIGDALENAAKEKKDKEIRAKTTELADCLRSIRIIYE